MKEVFCLKRVRKSTERARANLIKVKTRKIRRKKERRKRRGELELKQT